MSTTSAVRTAARPARFVDEAPELAPRRHRILVVDDDEAVRGALTDLLEEQGHAVDAVETGKAALASLGRELYDTVLLDLHLPDMTGLSVLTAAATLQTDALFIIMTAFGSIDTAVEAMKLGAFDYLTKPFRTAELQLMLERTLRETDRRRELVHLRRAAGEGVRGRIIGRTAVMERMFDLMERVAPMRATVLIQGETGTGKELVARAIHELSGRARHRFVAVNCSALPETLLEAELFGHVKGSFTGAVGSRRGLIEEAHDGTLFLDEIGTIPESIQVKLLRVLQDRHVQRIGGSQPVPVNFRLIAATNLDLAEEVAAGRFREDLFYRLNVFPIRVPPLRERRQDIPLLVEHFRRSAARENGIDTPPISSASLARLMAYDWPGNVRELENAVERAVILHAGGPELRVEPPTRAENRDDRALLERAARAGWNLDELEREYILLTLERTRGHQGRAAAILGIDRRTLYRKLKQLRQQGLSLPAGVTHRSTGRPRLQSSTAGR